MEGDNCLRKYGVVMAMNINILIRKCKNLTVIDLHDLEQEQ
jgi:hypothetical protein